MSVLTALSVLSKLSILSAILLPEEVAPGVAAGLHGDVDVGIEWLDAHHAGRDFVSDGERMPRGLGEYGKGCRTAFYDKLRREGGIEHGAAYFRHCAAQIDGSILACADFLVAYGEHGAACLCVARQYGFSP